MASGISIDGWLQGARLLPSPHCNSRPYDTVVNMLVIHNISLPPGEFGGECVDALFCGTLDCDAHPALADLHGVRVSAHFFINRQGEVTQYVPVTARAWHAGVSQWAGRDNCNDFSIGIELEGTDTEPYTDAQYIALGNLSAVLIQQYPEITVARVVGHNEIAPGRKTDPGAAFDWPRYRQLLQASFK